MPMWNARREMDNEGTFEKEVPIETLNEKI